MSSTTKNLGLTTWTDTDPVDFEEINANFEKIDTNAATVNSKFEEMNNLINCIESGTISAAYTGGSQTTIEWHYKKYSDGSVDMSGILNYTDLICSNGEAVPYYSSDSTINFPFTFSSIYDVQMHLMATTLGWILNVTGDTILDHISFRLYSMTKESAAENKQIFINIKGMLAD